MGRCVLGQGSGEGRVGRFLPILVAWCLLSACGRGATYRKPDLRVPGSWDSDGSSLNSGGRAGEAGDLSAWWRHLDDPVLSELIQEALRSNIDLLKSVARLREARARRVIAGAARKPTVSGTGSAGTRFASNQEGRTENTNSLAAGLDASWELDVFGGVTGAIDAAAADVEVVEAETHGVRVSLAAEVALAYVEVRSARLHLEIFEKSTALQEETLQLLRLRNDAGLENAQELEQAISQLEQTRAQLPALQLSSTEALYRLDLLLGLTPGSTRARLAGDVDLPRIPATFAIGIPAEVLRRRPDIRAAERKLAAETAREGVARAQLYPSFKLSGSFGVEMLLGNGTSAFVSLLGGITVPLFDGGRLRAQLKLQTAVCDQALLAYRQVILTALREVQGAVSTLTRQRERKETLTRALEAARRADELARQRFAAGVIDFQPVLETGRSLLTLEDGLATTRAAEVNALIQLYKALGGGWSPASSSSQAGEGHKP
jgi:NodT family efflux transporter outer membrane factor (OMF) lipoprotein